LRRKHKGHKLFLFFLLALLGHPGVDGLGMMWNNLSDQTFLYKLIESFAGKRASDLKFKPV
jgi:hypothetical protein